MAPALVHFLVGASIFLLVATPVAIRREFPPWVPLWLVAIGGLWGLLPDLHHVAPVYGAEISTFHDSRWADLFALHYTLDQSITHARGIASIAGSILLFLGAVGVFTVATYVNPLSGRATRGSNR